MMRYQLTTFLCAFVACIVLAGIEENIAYYPEGTEAILNEKCQLDLYVPDGVEDFPTVVWFHGGGLKGGKRYIPEELKGKGIAVAAVSYRLSPGVKAPSYIEDAATATAWVFKHIAEYGGNPDKIYLSGHSAGGYLVAMLGLDEKWLWAEGIEMASIAGVIPFSGQTLTHFTIREERGLPRERPLIDELAPVYHVRAEAPPFLLITGDRDLELPARYEENALLYALMVMKGHKDINLYELQGFGHGDMRAGGYALLLKFIAAHEAD